jgi:phosphate starvation-inducible PhoH-like protein
MRGRTLSNCFALLDEAQNTTSSQMMMFLTRLGEGSKMVVTGDVTQVDLPNRRESGLVEVEKILENVDGITFHHFQDTDVVRHPLVSEIIRLYGERSDHA